ncbi:MAG: cysteine--tRNA ligase [Patescibacteria group bacterium]|jgi:cysteinyl-tRNA synthetase
MLKLFNTLSRKVEEFQPLNPPQVGFYACGPTVYDQAHIGNLRSYIFADILHRTLIHNGYKVKFVMNITDVGHLTSDADEGEDKLEKGAKREHISVWDVAEKYIRLFKRDLKALNITEPDVWMKATDNIQEQIGLIKKLEAKGFTYKTSDGIYYDTSKFPSYGDLAKLNLPGQKEGARVEANKEKRNPTDFALWKFSPKNEKRQMEWESPWGIGFPGWHIECSAMSMKALGETFDIHTGGVDHIPVHHTNEIAQSEGATGKPFVKYWLHNEFLQVDGGKMAKSAGTFYTLDTLKEKGSPPMAYRYLVLGAHYRSKLNFTFEALKASQNAYDELVNRLANMADGPKIGCAEFESKFFDAIDNDLNTPQALAIMWEMLKSSNPDSAKKASLLKIDEILGLGLSKIKTIKVPKEIKELVEQRESARKDKDFKLSDELRSQINKSGFQVEDTESGPIIKAK